MRSKESLCMVKELVSVPEPFGELTDVTPADQYKLRTSDAIYHCTGAVRKLALTLSLTVKAMVNR